MRISWRFVIWWLVLAAATGGGFTGCAVKALRDAPKLPECPELKCSSFAALVRSEVLRVGDHVRILDNQGQRLTGTLLGLSPTEITARVNDTPMLLAERDVRGIWQRASRGRTMAVFGTSSATWLLGLGAFTAWSQHQPECFEDNCLHWNDVFATSAVGAIVGAGIGALWQPERQVFGGIGATTSQPAAQPSAGSTPVAVAWGKNQFGVSYVWAYKVEPTLIPAGDGAVRVGGDASVASSGFEAFYSRRFFVTTDRIAIGLDLPVMFVPTVELPPDPILDPGPEVPRDLFHAAGQLWVSRRQALAPRRGARGWRGTILRHPEWPAALGDASRRAPVAWRIGSAPGPLGHSRQLCRLRPGTAPGRVHRWHRQSLLTGR